MTNNAAAIFSIGDDDHSIEPSNTPFETQELLDAVDAVDRLRDFLNDTPNGGPPRLRTDLLRLHQRAMHVVNCQVDSGERETFFDDAVEIVDQVGEMAELIGRVESAMHRLADTSPSQIT